MWVVSAALMLVWFVLAVLFHKHGYVHILLIAALSVFGVEFIAYRKTRYHSKSK
jgi:hypothetical protein